MEIILQCIPNLFVQQLCMWWWADIRDNYQVLLNLLKVDIFYTQPATRIFQLDSKFSFKLSQKTKLGLGNNQRRGGHNFSSSFRIMNSRFLVFNFEIQQSKNFSTFIKTWNLKLFEGGLYAFCLKSRDFVYSSI